MRFVNQIMNLTIILKKIIMKRISFMRFKGTVEAINYDRNGAHLRMHLKSKEDCLRHIEVQADNSGYIDLCYWNGYEYDGEVAKTIRSLNADDNIEVTVVKTKNFFGQLETEVQVKNLATDKYENLIENDDLIGIMCL